MAVLKNQFTWSYSRHGLFAECKRKYWLNYYGSWGGWDRRGAPERVRELYIQKNLTTVPMWIGTVVHDAAEQCLKSLVRRRVPERQRVLGQALDRAQRNIQESRDGEWRRDPKRKGSFQLHYYEQEEPQGHLAEALQTIQSQIENLFESRVYRRMVQHPELILEVEELLSIDVGGVPVWVKLDGLMRGKDGGVVVVDWKTGKFHSDASVDQQLGVYGLYALSRWVDDPGAIKAMHVNLREGAWRTFDLDAALLADTRVFIGKSAGEMMALLSHVEDNIADEEDFPKLAEGDLRCGRCRFRRDCDRE
jgi:hypothetical protein